MNNMSIVSDESDSFIFPILHHFVLDTARVSMYEYFMSQKSLYRNYCHHFVQVNHFCLFVTVSQF